MAKLPAEISSLTKKQQTVLKLFVEDNMDVSQIADELSCSRSNVYHHLNAPKVKEVLMSVVRSRLTLASFGAARTLQKLSGNAKSETVQLEASKALLDRAGFAQPEQNSPALAIQINLNTDSSQ